MRRLGVLALATGLALALLPSAAAASTAVSTPAGKFYVEEGHGVRLPGLTEESNCFGQLCLIYPWVDPGGANVDVAVWEETNGCPDLQKHGTVCPQTDHRVPADDRLAKI